MQIPPLFEERTGRFVGLNAEQIATLNPAQRTAYDNLADATAALDAADKEYTDARDSHHAAVRALQEAEAAAAKQRKWTAHDEWKAMIAAGNGMPTDHDLLKRAIVKCQLAGLELNEENLRAHLSPGFILEIDNGDEPTLYDLQEALSESHVRLHVAEERMKERRGDVARLITAWQIANEGTPTFESLVRSHIQSGNAERARRIAEGERPSGRPGRSVVDQFAFATRNSGRRAGGGNGFRRGGVSYTEAMRINRERARQKLPSER